MSDMINDTQFPLYTVQEAADTLRVSYSTVIRMIQAGSLHAVKIAWLWRIPASEIARLLEPLPFSESLPEA